MDNSNDLIILNYLIHSNYLDSAKAFNRQLMNNAASVVDTPTATTTSLSAINLTKGMDNDGDQSMSTKHDVGQSSEERGEEEEEEDDENEDIDVSNSLTSSRKDNVSPPTRATRKDVNSSTVDQIEEEDHPSSLMSSKVARETSCRRDIRDHILAGHVQLAILLINRHFPNVLAGSPSALKTPSPSTESTQPKFDARSFFLPSFDSIPPSSSSGTSTPAKPPIISAPQTSNGNGSSPLKPASAIKTTTASSVILRPTIISMNLQIQSFVELIRNASTAAGSTPSSPDATSTTLNNGDSPPQHLNGGTLDPMSVSTSSIASARTTSLSQAISDAQILFSHVQLMEISTEREIYGKELQNVAALMAYPDLWNSPVAHYLDQSRRTALAELCNAAILVHLNYTATPVLELIVRQTTAVWSSLVDAKVGYPGTDSKDKNRRMISPFNLHTFLSQIEGEEEISKAMDGSSSSSPPPAIVEPNRRAFGRSDLFGNEPR